MNIEDLSTEMRSHLYTRLSNPLISHFIFLWCLFNWRLFAVLFIGDEGYAERLVYITNNIQFEYAFPTVLSLFWVFIWPFLNEWIMKFWEWRISVLRKIKKSYSDSEMLTIEESNKFREELNIQKERFQKLLASRDNDLSEIRSELNRTLSVLSTEQVATAIENDSQDRKDFMRPFMPSSELVKIVGNAPLTKTEAVTKIWEYIKENHLQDPVDRRTVRVDSALKEIFAGSETISMFEIPKMLLRHLNEVDGVRFVRRENE